MKPTDTDDCPLLLIAAAGNSLSHVGKALALRPALLAAGFKVVLAGSARFRSFFDEQAIDFVALPDLQEADQVSFPTVAWFMDAGHIAACLDSEIALLAALRPAAVIGIFRFTLRAAAAIVGIRYYTLSCGCLLPGQEFSLGVADDSPLKARQRRNIDYFFRYAGSRLGRVCRDFGFADNFSDAREMLVGEHTFLWDFPGFLAVKAPAAISHIGPLEWRGWNFSDVADEAEPIGGRLAIISFGTCNNSTEILARLSQTLVRLGFRVLIARGGRGAEICEPVFPPGVTVAAMLDLEKVLPRASMLVTHGGQLTIFAALKARVPMAVMPFQPEQAHNGICLQQMGCGRLLIDEVVFDGRADVYRQALAGLSDDELAGRLLAVGRLPGLQDNLARRARELAALRGADTVAGHLARELA